MSIIDLTVYSGLAVAAAAPLFAPLISKFRPTSAPAKGDDWTQRWATLLIRLVEELESKGDAAAASIGRDLIWAIIGGKGETEKKR